MRSAGATLAAAAQREIPGDARGNRRFAGASLVAAIESRSGRLEAGIGRRFEA